MLLSSVSYLPRLAWRTLRRDAGLVIAAVAMLSMATAVAVVIFSAVEAVLLRPLPFHDPDALVVLRNRDAAQSTSVGEMSLVDLREWRAQAAVPGLDVFTSVNWRYRVSAPGEPFTLTYSAVSGTFFDTLGIKPLLGRTFRQDDDAAGAAGTLVLGADVWRRRFSADPAIVGRRLTIGDGPDARPFEVIGVVAADFQFPAGAEAWAPAARDIAEFTARRAQGIDDWTDLRVFLAVGRLAPGTSPEHATAALTVIADRREKAAGNHDARMVALVTPLPQYLVGRARQGLYAMAAGVVALLLIACANAAGLLLVHGVTRQRDMALQLALGASRRQLATQLLLQAATLAVVSSTIGLALAYAGVRTLVALAPANVPRLSTTSIDVHSLVFATAVCLLTTMIVGLWPAMWLSRPDVTSALLQGPRMGTGGRAATRTRQLLVVGQLTAAVVLLTAAGLLGRSFVALMKVDLGFDPAHVLTFQLSVPESRYATDHARRDLVAEIVRRVDALSGVVSAGAIYQRPLVHGPLGMDVGFISEGQPFTDETFNRNPTLNWQAVTPRYFEAMKMRLRRGRLLLDSDDENAPIAIVVGESLARRVWPGQEAIGKRLRTFGSAGPSGPRWQQVVGVVNDVSYRGVAEQRLDLYMPFRQAPLAVQDYVVRVSGDALSIVPALKATIGGIDREIALERISTMEQVVADVVAPWRFNMLVFAVFSAAALTFAAIGLSTVMAYAVRQRRREIGIRMALGAGRGRVVRALLGEAAAIVAAALTLGCLAAWGVTRLLGSLLFGVTPTDTVTFVGVAALLSAVTLLAAYVPAQRATAIDPATTLRTD
jgi:putative ABC transport system permease protein